MIRVVLLFAFIAIPVAEIALFIEVGSLIGLWRTIAVIFITAIIGVTMLRRQGLATLANAQQAMDQGQLPVDSLIHGILLLIAGAFLLTPGFLTDGVGFALLVPALRLWIGQRVWGLIQRANVHQTTRFEAEFRDTRRPGDDTSGPIIEGEVVDKKQSPWRAGGGKPDKPEE